MRNGVVFIVAMLLTAACFRMPTPDVGSSLVQSCVMAAIAGVAVLLMRPRSLLLPRQRGHASRVATPLAQARGAASLVPAGVLVVAAGAVGGVLFGACGEWASSGARGAEVLVRGGQVVALCVLTGVAEEALYRVAALEAFVPALGGGRRAVLPAAAASAVIFALLHMGTPADGSAIAAAQLVIKPVQAALFGFTLALLYWHTRSLWPCAALHAAFDVLYLGPSLMASGVAATTYATGNGLDLLALVASTAVIAGAAALAFRSFRHSEKFS